MRESASSLPLPAVFVVLTRGALGYVNHMKWRLKTALRDIECARGSSITWKSSGQSSKSSPILLSRWPVYVDEGMSMVKEKDEDVVLLLFCSVVCMFRSSGAIPDLDCFFSRAWQGQRICLSWVQSAQPKAIPNSSLMSSWKRRHMHNGWWWNEHDMNSIRVDISRAPASPWNNISLLPVSV